MSSTSPKNQVILFDGVCNLCSSLVQFIIRYDKKNVFKFASLQSDYGKTFLYNNGLTEYSFSTFFLYRDGTVYKRSTAALLVARQLSGLWPLLWIFIIVPAFLRNWVYMLVANNRYKWFGKNQSCFVPGAKIKTKFFT